MTTLRTLLLAAAVMAPGVAAAQTVAVADPQAAIANTKAWAAAKAQIQTTYKAQIDQAQARTTAIQGELQPLVAKLQADQKANVAQATLQTEYNTIQQRQNAGQQEISTITAPAERAQAYAVEQLSAKLPDAVQAAVRARNVQLLVRPDAVLFTQPAGDLTPAITTELDRLVPSVSITPPAGWQPGQQGGAAPAAVAPTATPTRAPTSTRRSSGR